MTARLRQVTPKELIRVFERLGFIIRRITGSHVILRHSATGKIISIPYHSSELKRGLLFGIIKQAGVRVSDIENLL